MIKKKTIESPQDSKAKNKEDDTIIIPEDLPALITEGKIPFEDLGLPREILAAIADLGFQYCTPIQEAILSQVIDGGDAAGDLISILTRLLRHDEPGKRPQGSPRALILAPTRELVCQIEKDALGLAKFTSFSIASAYGGIACKQQRKQFIGKQVDILVTDLVMSKMDGLAVIRSAKEIFPDMPVVLMTAFGIVTCPRSATFACISTPFVYKSMY